ncbi:SRPBCC family protein [Streptomyces sp. B6B3]|uniref:SRPBCC family protein n=1 Tax=Streptomyces sp. B6B3 TaxID=3153570 RepID=UPI00325CEFD2
MGLVQESVEVDVPLSMAYNQWTQFEEFPHFMEGVEEVVQIDDVHNHWRTSIAGVRREFDTEIVDQVPDERIAWRTTGGEISQHGIVTFRKLDEDHTKVNLVMEVQSDGTAEKFADMVGILDRRAKGDIKRFKSYIEHREDESGAWRGRITPA